MPRYEVPDMTLIPQKLNMSCWYASAQMLIQWKQDQAQASLASLVPPDLDEECALTSWYAFGTSVSTRDTGRDVEAVFLYVPT